MKTMKNISLVGLTESQIEELEEQIKKMKEDNMPKVNLDYKNGYVIYGNKVVAANTFQKYLVDQLASIGLYRKTKESAEKLLHKLQVEEQLRRWSLTCEKELDWEDLDQQKYYCCYDQSTDEVYRICSRTMTNSAGHGTIYFTSKRVLEHAIEVIGEQMLKDYFTA